MENDRQLHTRVVCMATCVCTAYGIFLPRFLMPIHCVHCKSNVNGMLMQQPSIR